LADCPSFEVEKGPNIGPGLGSYAIDHVRWMMKLESSWSRGLVEAIIDGY